MAIRFGAFTLDLDTRQLRRGRQVRHLTPKAFELLAILIAERPKALSKTELQEHLWPQTFVAEANLSNLIAEVREALGDRARSPIFIRTAHGFGYAFCGDATDAHAGRTALRVRPSWIEWGQKRFQLSAGDNIVGRDPEADIRLDSSTVSRRHARFVVTPLGTALEDAGSKNGTFRGDERVIARVQLTDGDIIGIGSFRVTFHEHALLGSTETQGMSVT